MEDVHILTLNTSRIGHLSTNISVPSGDGSSGSSTLDGIKKNITSGINSIIDGAESIAGDIANDIAKDLGIHDFYTAHVMSFCEGFYKGNTTEGVSMNVTHCSKPKGMYSFDPTVILQKELIKGVSLKDIKWPEKVQDGLNALSMAARAMFVFYMIGIATVGLMIFTSLAGLSGSPLVSAINFFLSHFAYLNLAIASAIATAIAVKSSNIINKYGADIGIAAYKGGKFIAMTWAATALALVASLAWIVIFFLGRKGRGGYLAAGS
ncbi:MAG: hypothetical protein M1840_004061 [Geoglossum simile]|nr:MAG: hypothetical protein M1840_004061 [Geoglossum simile]